jgi:hypothetical protein
LIALVVLAIFLLKQNQRNQLRLLRMTVTSTRSSQQFSSQMAQSLLAVQKEATRQLRVPFELVDKAMALVGSADPLAFQQVQAMSIPSGYSDFDNFDPSDDGEIKRIKQRNPSLVEDDLNGFEESFIADVLAATGDGGDYFSSGDTDETTYSG